MYYSLGGTVQESVNPDKSAEQVAEESAAGHELYTKSHGAYNAGEYSTDNSKHYTYFSDRWMLHVGTW